MIKEIKHTSVPKIMWEEANKLQEGGICFIYRDYSAIRMETVDGYCPYVWRNNSWRPMQRPLRSLMRV